MAFQFLKHSSVNGSMNVSLHLSRQLMIRSQQSPLDLIVEFIIWLFKLKFAPSLYYQNIHVATHVRVVYRLHSCRDKKNIVAT